MLRLSALLTSALLAAAPLAAQGATAPAAAQEPGGVELKDADHKKLGRPFGKWFEAKLKNDFEDYTEALADLVKECESFDKKLKPRSVLALVKDWEVILDSGREYPTTGPLQKKGKAFALELPGGQSCAVRLPAEYNPKKESYAAVMVLAAGKAEDTLDAVPAEWKERFVLIGVDLAGLDAESLFGEAGLTRMLAPIGVASREYRIHRGRLFLVGLGDFGVAAASRLAAIYPMPFAGCAWVDGEPAAALNAVNLKLLAAEKKADMAEALGWFAQLPDRNAYPTDFEVVLTEPWQGRHYWVQALRFDPLTAVPTGKIARFKAHVDRASNTITLDSEFVYQYKLYLNDAIVDLDREIVIVRNGESYKFKADRSVGTLLDNFANLLDPGMVFPAWLQRLDVPIPASTGEGR